MVGPVLAGDLVNYSESDYTGLTVTQTEGGGPGGGEEMQQLTLRQLRVHTTQLQLSIRTFKLAVKKDIFLHKYFNCERVGDISC